MLWKTIGFSGNENQQSYDYSYDNLNRLKKATYHSSGKTNHYDVGGNDNGGIEYDLNGNILNLKRHHAGTLIDDLSFDYLGNRLTSVADAASDIGEGFVEASNGLVANEYGYDANGNLTKDDNKGLTSIDYNVLNLPRLVVQSNGDVITYVYDAAGTKLAKTVDDGSPETSYYDGPFHYIGNVLQFIQTAEGRTRKSGSNFNYEYNLTDHLGNVRASVNASGSVLQRDGYYPFGLTFNHSNVSPENEYKYNGFELQGGMMQLYDYQARYYDPALGRFLNVDPAADLMRRHSTYSYAFNNPIRFIDPDGMVPTDGYSSLPSHQAYDYHAHSQAAGDSPDIEGQSRKKKKQKPKKKSKKHWIQKWADAWNKNAETHGWFWNRLFGNKNPTAKENRDTGNQFLLDFFAGNVMFFFDPPTRSTRAKSPKKAVPLRKIKITKSGIARIRQHLSRMDPDEANNVMIRRLGDIANGNLDPTATDLNFYAHELREMDLMSTGLNDKQAHIQVLEEYGINYERGFEKSLYTPEALNAGDDALLNGN